MHIPKVYGALVFTESSFKNTKHALKRVKGLAGVDSHLWGSVTPYNVHHPIGNLYAGAWLLRMYLDEHSDNYEDALTAYKGWCPEGRRRACRVLEVRRTF